MPDSAAAPVDTELRALIERALGAHYELDAEIGRGGFGIVYRARDRRLKRVVAIKILPPELAFRSEIKTRFLREAETAAQLNHPNIVPIYSVDEADGLVYFAMAYVTGDNLAKRLHERGVLSPDETRAVLRDVGDALAYAHERGVIHRDIKPDNILLDADSGRPMVTDFGIARAGDGSDSRLTATGVAIGTPAYMSPEQAAGEREIDGRSDLYSLGILGYQMLTGEPPFQASSTPAMLVKHISERPVPVDQRRPDTPDDLARAIMLLLEKDPANRFPSAASLVAALDGGTGAFPARRDSGSLGMGGPVGTIRSPQPGYASPRGGYSAQSGYASPSAPPPYGAMEPYMGGRPPMPISGEHPYTPTSEDIRRWDAPQVQAFRRKLAPYLFVNGVIVLAWIFGASDIIGVTVIWSIFMAFKYAKLWADGYDWRDVFRQPRDRELIEVFDDAMEYVRSIFDGDRRKALREKKRMKRLSRGTDGRVFDPRPSGDAGATMAAIQAAGVHGQRIRQAAADRDEVLRLVDSMSAADRARVPDVTRSAVALHERVQALAVAVADLDRSVAPGGLEQVEAEIERLERAANPLDHAGSEERVRRLAHLKRQRRAVSELASRRAAAMAKLDTCCMALQNMKLDVLRLRAGAQTPQQITALALEALHLADSVDQALYVADELRGATSPRGASRSSAGGRG